MKIFEKSIKYSSKTGKPMGEEWNQTGDACDLCGRILDPNDFEGYPTYSFKIEESDSIEPQFHEDHLILDVGGKGFNVDLYELFNVHDSFIYCPPWDCDCETRLLQTKSDQGGWHSLINVMHSCRYRAIKKLVMDGVTVEQLQLVER